MKFLADEGAAWAALLPVDLHFLNVAQRASLDALMLFHPVKQRANGNQVFVDRLGRQGLLGSPRLKRVGGNVLDLTPCAFPHETAHAVFEFVNVLTVAAHGLQVGDVIRQVFFQRGL
ncbi:MAG: hypothetical protein WCC08_12690 [Terrimicrobiaceae bacterium]